MNEKYRYVYAHINRIDGKKYIGITDNLNVRWKSNGSAYKTSPYFWNAIQKYGWDNFDHIVLEESIMSKEDASNKEIYYISLYNTTNPEYGYNIQSGGYYSSGMKGKHHTEETKKKNRYVF